MYVKWQNSLLRNTIYPGVFLFMFLFLAIFMQSIGAGSSVLASLFGQSTFSIIAASGDSFLYTLGQTIAIIGITLGFVILMLKEAIEFSDDIGVAGAEQAKKLAGWTRKNITDRYTGAATFIPRWAGGKVYQQTVGRVAGTLQTNIGKTAFGQTRVGSIVRREVLAPVAASTVTPAARSYTGYQAVEKERIRGGAEYERDEKNRDAVRKATAGETLTADEENRLRGMGQRELEIFKANELKPVADRLTSSQIDMIGKSDKYTEADKDEMRKNWSAPRVKDATRLAELTAEEADIKAKAAAAGFTGKVGLTRDKQEEKDKLTPLVKAYGKPELDAFSANDLTQVAQLLTEKQIDLISQSAKFTALEKGAVQNKWSETAPTAPLQQANKIIDELRKINGDLQSGGVPIAKLIARLGTKDTPVSGGTISEASIKELADEMKKASDITRADLDKNRGALNTLIRNKETDAGKIAAAREEVVKANARVRQAQEGVAALKQLDDTRKNVPQNIGGSSRAGEFAAK